MLGGFLFLASIGFQQPLVSCLFASVILIYLLQINDVFNIGYFFKRTSVFIIQGVAAAAGKALI